MYLMSTKLNHNVVDLGTRSSTWSLIELKSIEASKIKIESFWSTTNYLSRIEFHIQQILHHKTRFKLIKTVTMKD